MIAAPKPRINLAGKVVGRLTVVEFARVKRTARGSQYLWRCVCACSETVEVDGACLRRATTISCGCYRRERGTKHGKARRDEHGRDHWAYTLWRGIKGRCLNPNNEKYADYGGRGISICDRWLNSFEAFYADMGERPTSQHTIDRIDNAGNYEPGNCRWATRAEQNENTRQTRLLTFQGVTLSIRKWARRLGIDRKTITSRLDRLGWSVERALGTPPRPLAPPSRRLAAEATEGELRAERFGE